jgi:4-hydroxybenzoate polyprenyltransferase
MPGLLPLLRLLRAGTLFSPAADVLAGRCILAAAGESIWTGDLVRLMAASALIYAAGMVCNDVADVEEDRAQRPERPIPRGEISRTAAAMLGVLLLGGGVALSPAPLHHGILAGLVLLYDFAAKRAALPGALCMGTLRGLNLASAAAMLGIAAPTTLIAAAACYGVYVFAITILGQFEEDSTVRPRAVAAISSRMKRVTSMTGNVSAVVRGYQSRSSNSPLLRSSPAASSPRAPKKRA